MKTFIKIFSLFILFLFFAPAVSFGADVSFNLEKNNFDQNQDFLVEVSLDTKNVAVNAIEGTVVFPDSLLELKEIRDGNSSINFWVEKPNNKISGEVSFSGITTGGFSGAKMFLFGLVFRAKQSGSGVFNLKDIKILQNDGKGTQVSTKIIPYSFSISKKSGASTEEGLVIKDDRLPEDFHPFVANDPDIFGGKYFLVFSATDKGTGIDHYEVRESFWGFGGDYVKADSPYLLKDQTLKSNIYIKAFDKSNNSRLVKLLAKNKLALLEQCLIIGIILFVCIFFYKKIWPKFLRR